MNGTETCDICFAKDREVLISPAAERRMNDLIQAAVHQISELPGAELSGDDSGLNDVFQEWADQLAFEQSIMFHEFDRLAEGVCLHIARELGELELSVLAAFSDEFGEYSCGDEFMENGSLEGFDALNAVSQQLYRRTAEFAVEWAEQRRFGSD